MQRLLISLVILGAALLAGCANLPATIEALGKDPATVCARLSTVYGTLNVARTNIVNGDVACNGDGLSVKSQGSTTIPITITPQAVKP